MYFLVILGFSVNGFLLNQRSEPFVGRYDLIILTGYHCEPWDLNVL